MVHRIRDLGIRVPFGSEHTPTSDLAEGKMETADSGEQVREGERN